MLLTIHIALASLGLLTSVFSLFRQKMNVIFVAYGLTASGVLSGVMLIIFGQASIIRVCIEGLIISSVSIAFAVAAQKRVHAFQTRV
jgi:hypothetical protein